MRARKKGLVFTTYLQLIPAFAPAPGRSKVYDYSEAASNVLQLSNAVAAVKPCQADQMQIDLQWQVDGSIAGRAIYAPYYDDDHMDSLLGAFTTLLGLAAESPRTLLSHALQHAPMTTTV